MIDIMIFQEMFDTATRREQVVIGLYFYHGYKQREISWLLGISQQRVSQLKRRAIEKYRSYVK